jgi:hypothetical protein
MRSVGGKQTIPSAVLYVGLATFFALEWPNSAQSIEILAPDLAFHFVCSPHTARSDVEMKTELFLRANSFRVLNLAKIQHRHNLHSFDTDMKGARDDQVIIEMISVPSGSSRYSFVLFSRPPTSRLSDLEDAVLKFVSNELDCETRQIKRSENGTERQQYFDSLLKRIGNLFEQADRINGERDI